MIALYGCEKEDIRPQQINLDYTEYVVEEYNESIDGYLGNKEFRNNWAYFDNKDSIRIVEFFVNGTTPVTIFIKTNNLDTLYREYYPESRKPIIVKEKVDSLRIYRGFVDASISSYKEFEKYLR